MGQARRPRLLGVYSKINGGARVSICRMAFIWAKAVDKFEK